MSCSVSSDTPIVDGVKTKHCDCDDLECIVKVHLLQDGHGRAEKTQCCGKSCTVTETGPTHWCVICGKNCCGICVIANYSGGPPEPPQRNVFCSQHEDFCVKHNLQYKSSNSLTAGLPSVSFDSSSDENGSSVEVEKPLEKLTPEIEEILKSLDWSHVSTTIGLTNLLKKPKKNAPFPTDPEKLTRFEGVHIPGKGLLPASLLTMDALRPFVLRRLHMSGYSGGKSKRQICEDIATKHKEYLEKKAAGKEHEFLNDSSGDGGLFRINTKRFYNVLMGGVIGPLLKTEYFNRLDKDELEDGQKTNQSFCEKFIAEYNDSSKYGTPVFTVLNFDQDPSKFTPIPEGSWNLVNQKIKDESSAYEKAYIQSKESGYHDDFENAPLVKTNGRLAYLHRMLEGMGKEDAGVFRKSLFGSLPEGVFSESTTNPSRPSRGGGGKRGGGGGGRGGGGKGAGKSRAGESAALSSIAKKNAAQERKADTERRVLLQGQMRTADDRQRKLMKELEGNVGDKEQAKIRYKAFEKEKKQRENDPSNNNSDSDSDSDASMVPDSQQSLFKSIWEEKKVKKQAKQELKYIERNASKRARK